MQLNLIKNKVKSILNLDFHTSEVIFKSLASTIVKIFGLVATLLVSIFLGRSIGANGLGIINLSNNIVGVLIILGLFGLRNVVIKEVAIARSNEDWNQVGNVMYSSFWLSGVISFIFSISFILLAPWLSINIFKNPNLTYPLIIFILVLLPQVFSRIFSSGMVGYEKIWQSNLVEQTLSTVITAVLLLILFLFNYELNVVVVAICFAFGRLCVTISTGLYWKKLFNKQAGRVLIIKELTKTSIPLLFVSATLVLLASIDTIMLGWLSNSTEVGFYSVALRLALMTSFFLQISNSAIMPKIAILYKKKQKTEMQLMVNKTTFILFILGIVTVLVFILFGRTILSLWGGEFVQAYPVLIILSVGQLFNIASGPVGSILAMCNYERILQNITLLNLGLNIILNYFLISSFGMIGAAYSTAITTALIMILASIYVKIKLGFFPLNFRFNESA